MLEPLELELQVVVSHHVGLELNLGPLEEQSGLLTAEPSFQPQYMFSIAITGMKSCSMYSFCEGTSLASVKA